MMWEHGRVEEAPVEKSSGIATQSRLIEVIGDWAALVEVPGPVGGEVSPPPSFLRKHEDDGYHQAKKGKIAVRERLYYYLRWSLPPLSYSGTETEEEVGGGAGASGGGEGTAI